MLGCFKNALPEPQPRKKELRVDIPDNAEFRQAIDKTKRKAVCLLTLLDQMCMYVTEEDHIGICKTIDTLGGNIFRDCTEFERMRYGYTDKPM